MQPKAVPLMQQWSWITQSPFAIFPNSVWWGKNATGTWIHHCSYCKEALRGLGYRNSSWLWHLPEGSLWQDWAQNDLFLIWGSITAGKGSWGTRFSDTTKSTIVWTLRGYWRERSNPVRHFYRCIVSNMGIITLMSMNCYKHKIKCMLCWTKARAQSHQI